MKYPNLVDGEKIIIQNLAETAFNEEQNMYDLNNMKKSELMQMKQLFDLCNANGIPRPCDDFNPKGYTMFYSENDPYFISDNTENVIHNQLKIYNKEDKNNLQIYQGDLIADGIRHGQGKCTTPYYVLNDQWKNDKFSGWGRESRCNGDVFEGKYENGSLNGKGIFLNEKKCKYINIEGVGKFKWKNGDVYKGQVKFGKMHGNGIYKFKNGKEYKGIFNMGKRMNERIYNYQNWKSTYYGVPPNQIYHINRNPVVNEATEINQINN